MVVFSKLVLSIPMFTEISHRNNRHKNVISQMFDRDLNTHLEIVRQTRKCIIKSKTKMIVAMILISVPLLLICFIILLQLPETALNKMTDFSKHI